MDVVKLIELKQRLVTATSFSSVYGFFFDHFGNDPELRAGGTKIKDAVIEQVFDATFDQLEKGAKAESTLLFKLPKYHLIHGIANTNNHPHGIFGIVIFFEDISMGLIALGKDAQGPNLFARFRTVLIDGKRTLQLN